MTSKAKQENSKKSNSRELDQFYTDPSYAKQFLDIIQKEVDLSKFDYLLEPSAGTGSFYNLLDPARRIGLDLEPKATGIVKTDFFEWMQPVGYSFATIGNPPFGKNSSLAVKFFNRAAEFSDVIAFVIPRTFRKASIVNRLNNKFHKIYDETVPSDSFIFNGQAYDVPCCAQIWVKRDQPRVKIKTYKLSQIKNYFEIVEPGKSDFAIQRVGGRAGLIRTENHTEFSPLSHYFIKAKTKDVLPVFQQLNFDSVKFNTAGNPSISPSELIELFIKESQAQGITLTLL